MLIQDQSTTNCIRCGKPRIFWRKWKDRENNKGSQILHVETVCPDKECQKLVDEKFQEMRDRRALAENRKKSVILAKTAKSKAVIKFEA